jgi:GNAT superfamily N-acetyltransferase
MKIIEVKDHKTKRDFLELVVDIYKHDPNYVRPLDLEIESIFDPSKNNFHSHGSVTRWVLYNDSYTAIGRVAAFINEKKAYTFEQPTGGMGFFECIDDDNAAKILMDTARNWLQSKGMEAMDGPINFGENDNFWGLLIWGFTHPAIGMNYNPPYYQKFFESYGFKTYFEQVSNHLDLTKKLPERFAKIADWVTKKEGYHFEHFKINQLEKYSNDFQEIYNDAWRFHENFTEMNAITVQESLEKIKPFMDERLILFAYVNNEPAAFIVIVPDLNQIVKHLNGKLNFMSKLKFIYHKWVGTMNRLRVIIMGVKPKYQKLGLESALIMKAHDVVMPMNKYKEVELSWVGDFNPKMRAIHESMGATLGKKHITYRCLFNDTKDFKRSSIIELGKKA